MKSIKVRMWIWIVESHLIIISVTGINNKEFKEPHHIVFLMYKFDKENPTNNFQEESKIFGKQPEAGNIFIVKNPEEELTESGPGVRCSCGRARKPDDPKINERITKGRRIIRGEEVDPVRQPFCKYFEIKILFDSGEQISMDGFSSKNK